MQIELIQMPETIVTKPFRRQLLKWIGNKQKFAPEIVSFFPDSYGTYFEPFLGSAGVLGFLAPKTGFGGDCFRPLIEIWQTLRKEPERLKRWYRDRWQQMQSGEKISGYESIKASYNAKPNPA